MKTLTAVLLLFISAVGASAQKKTVYNDFLVTVTSIKYSDVKKDTEGLIVRTTFVTAKRGKVIYKLFCDQAILNDTPMAAACPELEAGETYLVSRWQWNGEILVSFGFDKLGGRSKNWNATAFVVVSEAAGDQ